MTFTFSLLKKAVTVAESAALEALSLQRGDLEVEIKADDSPVTIGDRRANQILVEGLQSFSTYQIVSEELPLPGTPVPTYWLIDPIDGTKSYKRGSPEWCVLLSLVVDGEALLGVVVEPASGKCYSGAVGLGTFVHPLGDFDSREELLVPEFTEFKNPLTVLISYSRGKETGFSLGMNPFEVKRLSSALKGCEVVNGNADLSIQTGSTHSWDTAAVQALGRAIRTVVNGQAQHCDEAPIQFVSLADRSVQLSYFDPGAINPGFMIARKELLNELVMEV